jgi:hypothetical protein
VALRDEEMWCNHNNTTDGGAGPRSSASGRGPIGGLIGAIADGRAPSRQRRLMAVALGVGGAAASLVLAAASMSLGGVSGPGATTNRDWSINPTTPLTAETFADPPTADRPWVRFNTPPEADPEQLQAELEHLHEAGIAGAEFGQGSFPDEEQLTALLTKANELGMKISVGGTSGGPTLAPPGYSINDDHARKSLLFGATTVDAGERFSGSVPAPAPQAGRTTTLIAVVAYRCAETLCSSESGITELVRRSAVNLTPRVSHTNSDGLLGETTAGTITWRAPRGPADAQWQLIGFWTRGVFDQPDPFSSEGHDQLIEGMETHLFTPEIKELMRANGGDVFYDSHSVFRGIPNELWTNEMAKEFSKRANYNLIPNLAGLFGPQFLYREGAWSTGCPSPGGFCPAGRGFSFDDGTAPRVLSDLIEVRTDLWIENHLEPLQEWLHGFNAALRIQPEGQRREIDVPFYDQPKVAAVLDRPEHESLHTGDEVDNYLPISSANHMSGNPWHSTECCATWAGGYLETLESVIVRMHKSYAGGITKLVYHTYPYPDGPDARWPGWSVFGTRFSESWGPRQPLWGDARAYNDYMARTQQMLTQGNAKRDVAVYMHNYLYPETFTYPGGFRIWRDPGLQRAGYTRDYLSPALMELPNATVKGGRLATDGPAYKALIINSELEPPTDPVKTAMPIGAAQKIRRYARAGLPVIVVGTPPNQTPGNPQGRDAALQELIRKLLREDTVHRVPNSAAVPGKLRELGIRPSAEPESPSRMLSIHREDEATGTDYYFLYNEGRIGAVGPDGPPENLWEPTPHFFEPPETCHTEGQQDQRLFPPGSTPPRHGASGLGPGLRRCIATGEAIDQLVTLEGTGRPYLLDAWSGEIQPIADYTRDGERVMIRVRLTRDDAMLVALTDDPKRFGRAPAPVHVTSTDADGAVQSDSDSLAIRAFEAGSYTTSLSDGTTVETSIDDVPGPIDLTDATWQLAAEDWQPANPYETTFGVEATVTSKLPVEVELDGLRPWPEIPELEDASGVGTYTTTVELPDGWTDEHGAILSVGHVVDSFTLAVNGESVPVNQVSGEADASPYLQPGTNAITIRVATTLNNRIRTLDAAAETRGVIQNNGLNGPVVLRPYRQATVWMK